MQPPVRLLHMVPRDGITCTTFRQIHITLAGLRSVSRHFELRLACVHTRCSLLHVSVCHDGTEQAGLNKCDCTRTVVGQIANSAPCKSASRIAWTRVPVAQRRALPHGAHLYYENSAIYSVASVGSVPNASLGFGGESQSLALEATK